MKRVEALLQQALSGWQDWAVPVETKPIVIEALSGGLTNRSFLVESGIYRAVVRINAENSQSLGIDRRREIEIRAQLQPMGCVPRTLFASEESLVSEYISGRCWQAADLKNKINLKKISILLKRIQGVSLPEKIIKRNYLAYCQSYIQQLPRSVQRLEQPFIDELLETAHTIDQGNWVPVISHHDLVPENIIESGDRLFLLDWEYAAYGHPAIDFLRIHGDNYNKPDGPSIKLLQKGMDKLWYLLQEVEKDSFGSRFNGASLPN